MNFVAHTFPLYFLTFIFLFSSCSIRGVQVRKAELLYKDGQTQLSAGNADKAVLKFEKSIYFAKKAGFNQGVAHNLNELAIIHTARTEYSMAREKLDEAKNIYKKLKMNTEVSKTLNNTALSYVKENDFPKAITQYEELLKWDKQTGNSLGVGITLNNMGLIYAKNMRNRDKARLNYKQALRIFKELGDERYIRLVEKQLVSLESR